ncbi:MAG TPA: hypothetical protein VFE17_07055 [Candidatus Baltobacteraceae bacterium]|nr:hypothetical protein [Candidatus Baltobacteraceae bacterium]
MKIIAIAAIVLGLGALIGTRRDTPFIRWGIIVTLAGVLLMAASALFTFRGVTFGIALALAGVGAYYYGRLVRKEQLFVAKPK